LEKNFDGDLLFSVELEEGDVVNEEDEEDFILELV
jgi:hypothetical protein